MLMESIKIAIGSLTANKMRALLTMLGIIVGIASVITIVSLGEGGKKEVLGQFDQIGASTVIIQVRSAQAQPGDYINQRDIEAIRTRIDSVKHVTAPLQAIGHASTETERRRILLSGIDADFMEFSPIEIVYGRLFTEVEYLDGFPVVIIDRAGAQALFGREDVVGERLTIEMGGRILPVTVAGVCESVASQFSAFAGGFDSEMEGRGGIPFFVYSPFMTVSSIVPDHNRLSTLNVMAVEPERVDEAGEAVINLLEMRRGNRDSSLYRSQNLASILDQINNVINILTWFISTVAGISLFVGGIGVMNIMLVSVTERTREIGIRKAIGATNTDILLQFMTESVVLTLMGGAMGILAGLGLAYGISAAADSLGIAQITPVLSLQAIIIAVAFSMGVGLFFGIYPARKAAHLHPIDALRHN